MKSDSENVKKEYDDWHQRLGELGEDNSDSPWHQMVKQNIGDIKNLKVLEIGCGRGGFSKYLADQQAKLVAADFSDSAVALARKILTGSPNCEAVVEDIQALSFADKTFDRVFSLETLEHVPDSDQGLAELVRVVKPGGQLFITTPNYFGLLGLYRAYREISGKGFSEVGQPINHPLKLKDRVKKLQNLNCRIDLVDGVGHYLYIPRTHGFRMKWLDQPKFLMKWLAAHSLTIATKLE
jgi:2-polyprenyl-3-methyl-5-hydroxy-6-metoxy-1,4-benzoquinol methylase